MFIKRYSKISVGPKEWSDIKTKIAVTMNGEMSQLM